jgi:MFS family permease
MIGGMHMFSQHTALGEGERLNRKRERQARAIKATLFGIGMLSGAWIGYFLASNDFALDAPWPPAIAIGLAVLYVAAILIGSMLLHKHIDEVERMRTYKAVTLAGTAYMIAYPVWFLLWKASLVAEPVHWILFIAFWALLIGAAFYYRSR